MNITNVRIRPYEVSENEKRLANAQVVLNDSLVLYRINIMKAVDDDGNERLWLSMPARRLPEMTASGEQRERVFADYFHPINKEAREELTKTVLDFYKQVQENPEAEFEAPEAEPLEIESVQVSFPKGDKATALAYAVVVLKNGMRLNQIRIVKNKDENLGLRMPGRMRPDNKFREFFHPITTEFRQALTKAVLDAYNSAAPEA